MARVVTARTGAALAGLPLAGLSLASLSLAGLSLARLSLASLSLAGLSLAGLSLAGLSLAGCREERPPTPAACAPRATEVCHCSATTTGVRTCDADGAWTPCRCVDPELLRARSEEAERARRAARQAALDVIAAERAALEAELHQARERPGGAAERATLERRLEALRVREARLRGVPPGTSRPPHEGGHDHDHDHGAPPDEPAAP